MTELEGIITELIRNTKEVFAGENIRFVNAYNPRVAEKPVEGYLALVEIGEIDDDVTLRARLIGGSDISGHELGYTAIELASAFREADVDGIIDTVHLGETKYDRNISAFYRDIKLRIVINKAEEAQNLEVYIGGVLLSGLNAFRCDESVEEFSLYEFNRGEPYAIINSRHHYDIILEIVSPDFRTFENGFELRAYNGDSSVSFLNCVIAAVSASINTRGQIVYKIRINSDEKVTV